MKEEENDNLVWNELEFEIGDWHKGFKLERRDNHSFIDKQHIYYPKHSIAKISKMYGNEKVFLGELRYLRHIELCYLINENHEDYIKKYNKGVNSIDKRIKKMSPQERADLYQDVINEYKDEKVEFSLCTQSGINYMGEGEDIKIAMSLSHSSSSFGLCTPMTLKSVNNQNAGYCMIRVNNMHLHHDGRYFPPQTYPERIFVDNRVTRHNCLVCLSNDLQS